jgi:hypothetical protein
LTDFANEHAVLIELEQPRLAASRVDEDVPLGIGCDADPFAEIRVRRQLEKIRHRVVGNFRTFCALALLCASAEPPDNQMAQTAASVMTRFIKRPPRRLQSTTNRLLNNAA